MCAMWLLWASVVAEKRWDSYEVFIAYYGKQAFVRSLAYSPMLGSPNSAGKGSPGIPGTPKSPGALPPGVYDYGATLCNQELERADMGRKRRLKKNGFFVCAKI